MLIHTDNSALTEHDSHSDSDWLDIASTDRDSDDNDSDSIYSSRDHEDPSRSRSRRSSLSYGSSRGEDVDAWEGLIEDSADDAIPSDVPAPGSHVASLSQDPLACHAHETSPEELRVKEGLDQSMISTLSSSRSSSLHASTVGNSSRDLRLSFPDPISSSRREPLSTSYEDIHPASDSPSSPVGSDAPSDVRQIDEDLLSASQVFSALDQATPAPSPSGPELKIFLYGFPTISKWSVVNRLLHKVAFGAGLSIHSNLANLEGSVRQLSVSGSFERDHAFPRIITVFDRTLESHDTAHDLALTDFSGVRSLAVVFLPCRPPSLPEHVLYLPIMLPSYSGEFSDFGIIDTSSSQRSLDALNIPNQRMIHMTAPEGSSTIHMTSIDTIDTLRAYRAFSRLWSSDNASRGMVASTHALTIIAILSLVLGLIVRAALPVSLQQFTTPNLPTLIPNSTCSLWQMIRPAPHRERLPPSTTLDSPVVTIPSQLKDFSLSVFNAESTAMTLVHANPTDFRRGVPSILSEPQNFPKDVILQPPCSLLPLDNRPKALSVIPETSPTTISSHPSSDTTEHAVSAMKRASIPSVVKEYASVISMMTNQDMQDIFDALDALVQAISRQTQMFLTQATTFIEQSAIYLEKSVESFDTIKETFEAHNERARKRAKEIKEKGTKWLYDTSEMITTGARFSRGIAWELAQGLAHRAQRARGKAKQVAGEIQDLLNEHDRLETWRVDAWDSHRMHWDEWVKARRPSKKACKRHTPSVFC